MNKHTACSRPGRRGADAPARPRAVSGFTLVEMLVVVVVIIILLGVVFKMVKPAGDKAAKAKTEAILAKLKAAVEEFYAEYGQYPPVPYYRNVEDASFSYPDGSGGTVTGGGLRLDIDDPVSVPAGALFQPLFYEYPGAMDSNLTGVFADRTWDEAPAFTFGLMSFLVTRYEDHAETLGYGSLFELGQWKDYNSKVGNTVGDQPRDRRAADRFAPFLAGITTGDMRARSVQGGAEGQFYYCSYITVYDAWRTPLIYVSSPPHQSYLLFSRGPDRKFYFKDPGNRSHPDNRDNVYGDTGY